MLVCVLLGVVIGALNGTLIGIMNLPPFFGNSLYLYDHPWTWFPVYSDTVAGTYTGGRMVPFNL